MDGGDGRSATRLYGGAIAVVSGVYSLLSATGWIGAGMGMDVGMGMGIADVVMLLLGVVVLVHGVVLFTDAAERLSGASGPLMVGYAVLMLLLQGWGATMGGSMGGGMGDGGMGDGGAMGGGPMDGAMTGMGWDPGMVAIAVLMFASGLIMTATGSTRSR